MDEWGKILDKSKAMISNIEIDVLDNFTNHGYDEILEVYYAKARFYDPNIQRFLAIDPIRDGLNWYAYAENNPVMFVDPLGMAGVPYVGTGINVSGWFNEERIRGIIDYSSAWWSGAQSIVNDPKGSWEMVTEAFETFDVVGYYQKVFCPENIEKALNSVGSFVGGTIHGYGQGMSGGLLEPIVDAINAAPPPNQTAYTLGKIVGNIGAGFTGLFLTGGGAVVGTITSPSGVGALVGYGTAAYGYTLIGSSYVFAVANIAELSSTSNTSGSSKGSNSHLTPQQMNEYKSKILGNNDVTFNSKQEALDFINKKFSNFKQEVAGSRSAEGWHFDSHSINGSSNSIEHINIYSKSQGFRVHITWTN